MFPARMHVCTYMPPGAHPRGGGGEGPAPLGPEKHYILRVSSVKLRDLHLT